MRLQEALSSATRALERAERRMGEEVERGGRLERELAGVWGTLEALRAAKKGEGDAHAAMDMEVSRPPPSTCTNSPFRQSACSIVP